MNGSFKHYAMWKGKVSKEHSSYDSTCPPSGLVSTLKLPRLGFINPSDMLCTPELLWSTNMPPSYLSLLHAPPRTSTYQSPACTPTGLSVCLFYLSTSSIIYYLCCRTLAKGLKGSTTEFNKFPRSLSSRSAQMCTGTGWQAHMLTVIYYTISMLCWYL